LACHLRLERLISSTSKPQESYWHLPMISKEFEPGPNGTYFTFFG
jgi:hypothetical protein